MKSENYLLDFDVNFEPDELDLQKLEFCFRYYKALYLDVTPEEVVSVAIGHLTNDIIKEKKKFIDSRK